MNTITLWVIQIIIFLIIATIVGLIVPDNRLKKYVNTVLGLLLLLTFAKPLMYFFSIDVESQIRQVEQAVFQDNSIQYEMENSLEFQKKEIQATQDAYILTEIERQLILEANPALINNHEYEITALDLDFNQQDESIRVIEDLQSITVHLKSELVMLERNDVEPIVIDTNKEIEITESVDHKQISKQLSEIWGVDANQINLVFEGGTS